MTPNEARKRVVQSNSKQAVLAAQIEQTNSVVADLRGKLEVTTQKLGFTQAELSAGADAGAEYSRLTKGKRREAHGADRQAKQEADAKIGLVSTDLTGAKGDITATKQDLEATRPSSPARSAILAFRAA